MTKKLVFGVLILASLTPWVSAPVALLMGLAFALTLGNPFQAESKKWQTWLLQGSVIGLGAGMDLGVVARVGLAGFGQTLLGLSLTLIFSLMLARLLNTEKTTSLLIGVGTAVCGGSAIAAAAPAIGAKSHQSSVALAVVFLLNAAALLLFPRIGSGLHLTAEQFGLWCALAIHDTSSVVGASMEFGPTSLAIGTTVKLARALWIIPLTLVLSRVWKAEHATSSGKPKQPWFILGFLCMAAVVTFVPSLQPAGKVVQMVARQSLVATLFLVGAGVSRQALAQVGVRPLILGVLLWAATASATLWAIIAGWLVAPNVI